MGRLVIVADRFDGLGARLFAIVSAAALARLLDGDFAFIWPHDEQTIAYGAQAMFSADFRRRHELAALPDCPAIADLRSDSVDDARAVVADMNGVAHWRVVDTRHVPFVGETLDDVGRRFREAAGTVGWSPEAVQTRDVVATAIPAGGTGVHVRMGDLIDGAWDQYVPRAKFRPRAIIEAALADLAAPALVVSDLPAYVEDLGRRVPVVTTVDAVPGYGALSAPMRDWADLVALSRVERIFAPSSSAFSGFAAALGGAAIVDPVDAIAESDRVRVLHAAVSSDAGAMPRLTAREIVFLLDSDHGELGVPERCRLAAEACRLDPDYAVAHARRAIALAASGSRTAARDAAERSRSVARRRSLHGDAKVEALVARFVVGMAAAVDGDEQERASLGRWRRAIGRRTTYQIRKADIERHLRFQHRLVAAVPDAPGAARTLTALEPHADPAEPSVWPGRAPDPTLHLVARVSRWLASAVGAGDEGWRRAGTVRARPEGDAVQGVRWMRFGVTGAAEVVAVRAGDGVRLATADRVRRQERAVFRLPIPEGVAMPDRLDLWVWNAPAE